MIAALGEKASWIGAHILVANAAVKPARGPVIFCLLWNRGTGLVRDLPVYDVKVLSLYAHIILWHVIFSDVLLNYFFDNCFLGSLWVQFLLGCFISLLFLGPLLLGSIGSGLPHLISLFHILSHLLSHLLRHLIVLRLLNCLCLAFLVAIDAEELARRPVVLSPLCKRWVHHLAKL